MEGSMKKINKYMNHLRRYWHGDLATKSFLTPGMMTVCSCLLFVRYNIIPFRNYTAPWDHVMPRKLLRIFRVHRFLKINLCLPGYFCLSVPGVFYVHGGCTWWWQWWGEKKMKQKPQLSSRVAHGKVRTGARTLSLWVKSMCTLGLGTALCWVTSLHDIRLTETNARGVSVKKDPIPLLWSN